MAEGDLVRDARFQLRVSAEDAASLTLRWATAEDRDVAFRLAHRKHGRRLGRLGRLGA